MKELLHRLELLESSVNFLKSGGVPIGSIQIFASQNIPDGWLFCDGSLCLIDQYPSLFDLLGTSFGGDGKTTFGIPDLQGQFVRGWDRDGNYDSRREFGSLQADALQGHRHNGTSDDNGEHSHTVYVDTKNPIKVNGIMATDERELSRLHNEDSYQTYKDNGAYRFSNVSTCKTGGHNHNFSILEVANGSFGCARVSVETRPRNIALLYCIKAY